MGFISFLFPWGIILQAIAVVHFIRRRPDTIWIYIIFFLGPLGALVYIFMEVLPDVGHMLPVERPAAFAARVVDFVTDAEARRS